MFGGTDIVTGEGSGIIGAAGWIAGLMTGTLATVIAILAVAAIGLAMLQGRLAARDAARAVLGCFILFGAPYIAGELAGVSRQDAPAPAVVYIAPAPSPIAPPRRALDSDPYAGASVPTQ